MQILKVVLLTGFLAINCFSQSKDTIDGHLKKGRWAVQFEVGNDFKLTSFDGLLVSLKYHLSNKTAIRFGAEVDLSNSDNDLDYLEYYNGYTGQGSYNDNSQNIILISNFLFYINPRSPLKVFLGIGPRGSYQHVNDERIYIDGFRGHRVIRAWTAGLNAVLGCEWFPMSFLSLFGEYSAYGTYGESKSEDYVVEISTNREVEYYNLKSTSFVFRGNVARLGISVYF